MNTGKYLRMAAALVIFFLGSGIVGVRASEHPIATTDGRQSKLWLVGDSSLHAYSSVANNMTLEIAFAPNSSKKGSDLWTSGGLESLELRVPVKEMRSGKNQLDKNMQKALKADDYPDIFFHFSNYEAIPSTTPSPGYILKVTGTLEIAGVKKEITLEGRLTSEAGSVLRVQGVQDVLMTDYGIKPPKILMIKTHNEVKVHYDLWLDSNGQLR